MEPLKGIFSDFHNIFLWHESEDINQKKGVSKIISLDSKFTFSSYVWLCVFHCSHRLLCWIKSRVRDFQVKIALILYWNDFSLIHLGKCASSKIAMKMCKKFKFWKFWERPLFDIREYAFKKTLIPRNFAMKFVPFMYALYSFIIHHHSS